MRLASSQLMTRFAFHTTSLVPLACHNHDKLYYKLAYKHIPYNGAVPITSQLALQTNNKLRTNTNNSHQLPCSLGYALNEPITA